MPDLINSRSWLQMIAKLPKLRELSLQECGLSDHFILSLSPSNYNFSSSLSVLDLSENSFTSSLILQWVSNITTNLVELDLSHNHLEGSISNHFGMVMNSLEHLDLSLNMFKGDVLKSFMNICTLHSLNMQGNNLTEDLPSILHNLSSGCIRYSLQDLDLSFNQITSSFSDLSVFSSLKMLDLSFNQLNGKISEGVRIPYQLESLSIQQNSLEGGIPISFRNACALSSLDLSSNNLNQELPMMIHHLSGCARYSLRDLNLAQNQINGMLPDLSTFSILKTLDLSENQLSGKIPKANKLPSQLEFLSIQSNTLEGGHVSFKNACALRSLDLSNNSLNEDFPMIIHHLSCARYSLETLDLSMNQINGTLPDLSIFSSLKSLYLFENKLKGDIPKDIRFPPQLMDLHMQSNSLKGVLNDYHFVNMSKLGSLDLSDNLLTLTFTKKWVPHFHLRTMRLRSCKLGPTFPKWLETQNDFLDLDISNAGISDKVPRWFWAKLALREHPDGEGILMNISYNNFYGIIPSFPLKKIYHSLILSSNQFEGHIPPFLRGFLLDLSKNKFSDSFSFLCGNDTVITSHQLDLSNNHLSGQIPDCWSHFETLSYLDLSHNNFSGKIPTSIRFLLGLQALLMRNNNLIDEIPFSLGSCTNLVMLDMAENKLSGSIPTWIGSQMEKLQILSLGMNHFNGSLPLQICYLRNIQLLDLSINELSGKIPKCIQNFTAMAQKMSSTYYQDHKYYISTGGEPFTKSFDLKALMMWKGLEQMFNNKELSLLKSIDLSSNHFSEEIPVEIENLFDLVSLNLSRNNLAGKIPSNIGRLTSLEFLDLSRNQIIGSIPLSLTQIDRLAMLDLSHNHLSGEIPTATQLQSFNVSSYEDNLNLCGPPLEKLCIFRGSTQEPNVEIHEDEYSLFRREFYIGMAIGFVISFWVVFGLILFWRSWQHAYVMFLNNLADNIYVKVAVFANKISRTSNT
ncbi:hypothetical protein VNO78_32903 [Psophocarpus tetragonolobus]|uniref:Uncharacterized protein n=1 Tax=Psophocarpus tetragonolobus TaxID=3891 RepID=A0AAN9P385_PSOTE